MQKENNLSRIALNSLASLPEKQAVSVPGHTNNFDCCIIRGRGIFVNYYGTDESNQVAVLTLCTIFPGHIVIKRKLIGIAVIINADLFATKYLPMH